MSAFRLIATALLVGSLIAMPAVVMAGGARNGNAGARAPASAVQQRDRLHDASAGTTQAQSRERIRSQDRIRAQEQLRTQDPAHAADATGAQSRQRKGQ